MATVQYMCVYELNIKHLDFDRNAGIVLSNAMLYIIFY